MSAFIVSAECMTNCVAAIMAHVDEFGGISTHRGIDGLPLARYDEAGQAIGAALWAMNREAVLQRYGADFNYADTPEWHYEHQTGGSFNLYQQCKSLACLEYQCTEGDIPERNPLFDELVEVQAAVACAIVYASEEYKMAKWG